MQNGLPGFKSGISFGRPDLSLVAGAQGPGKSGRNTAAHPQKSYPFFFISPYIYKCRKRSVLLWIGH